MPLKGKVALVTGASDTPGSHIAIALAKAGAKVAVEGLATVQEKVLRTVEKFGGDALPVRGNVVHESDVNHVLSNVEAILGPIDILVNTSGIRLSKPVADMTPADWDKVVGSKARAAFMCTRAVLPGMKSKGSGHIISYAASQSLHGEPGRAALCASEQALVGFNNALTRELAGSGIKVSLVTAAGALQGEDAPDSKGMDPEEIARAVVTLAGQEGKASSAHLIVRP
jgi:NAD(P)-dependent dehydrogenase (short-subunit alcohol dehydrogenase family)